MYTNIPLLWTNPVQQVPEAESCTQQPAVLWQLVLRGDHRATRTGPRGCASGDTPAIRDSTPPQDKEDLTADPS